MTLFYLTAYLLPWLPASGVALKWILSIEQEAKCHGERLRASGVVERGTSWGSQDFCESRDIYKCWRSDGPRYERDLKVGSIAILFGLLWPLWLPVLLPAWLVIKKTPETQAEKKAALVKREEKLKAEEAELDEKLKGLGIDL